MNALINKTYLENSFKDFDTQILEKKYLNQEDPSIHTHDNKDILDRIGESTEGKLLFNEKEIVSDNDSCVSKDDVLSTSTAVKENTQAGKLVDALVVKEVFQSVSDGKELIASAITDKGVETDATATFAEMADNISNIQGGNSGVGFDLSIVFPEYTIGNEVNVEVSFGTVTNNVQIEPEVL